VTARHRDVEKKIVFSMPEFVTSRRLFVAVFAACASLLGFAYYMQHVHYLLPCPLCVVQRMAYWLTGLTALVAAAHNPSFTIRRWYSAVMALWATIGAVVAAHHMWVIRHPAAGGCRISPEEQFLNSLPLAKWWPGMFEANGDCALVDWQFLSFAMPDWSFVWFLFFVGLAVLLFKGRVLNR
jgi:disulfide bond formation protein DsbB